MFHRLFRKAFRRVVTPRMTRFHSIMIVAAIMLMMTAVSFAQTATPFPEIEIPLGDSIGYLNGWLGIFGPILLFVGMIPVALGLLKYVIRMFAGAFGMASGR